MGGALLATGSSTNTSMSCSSDSAATSSALQAAIPDGTGGTGLNQASRIRTLCHALSALSFQFSALSSQLSVLSFQLSAFSFQFSVLSCQLSAAGSYRLS